MRCRFKFFTIWSHANEDEENSKNSKLQNCEKSGLAIW